MKNLIITFILMATSLQAKEVDIVSSFTVTELPVKDMTATRAGYKMKTIDLIQYERALSSEQPPKPEKILVWNYIISPTSVLFKQPKDNLVYFLWEPWLVDPSYYDLFSRVYTYDDSLIDGKKFFKFYYPVMQQMHSGLPVFEDKKFCTLVASNWTEERVQMIKFFETKPEGEFEFFGNSAYNSRLYHGAIPGGHTSDEKINTLKNYRFCICFENTHHLKGYITEKIFGCFAAGCVPVYWGAPNIEEYIPKKCFIDYRDFPTHEALYQHLKMMSKEAHNQYVENIRAFLKSEKAQLFTPAHFDKVFYEAITR
jgi:hypothetical protein